MQRFRVRQLERSPYTVAADYKRIREQYNVFGRVEFDEDFSLFGRRYYDNLSDSLQRGGKGNTRADHALFKASRSVYEGLLGIGALEKISEQLYRGPISKYAKGLPRVELSQSEAALQVKRAARFLGAGKVGITRIDRRWLYAPDEDETEQVPDELQFVVVMAFPMDAQAIATSPALPSSAATGLGYSHMAFTSVSVAEFIRDFGYRAIASGNHTGLNIPFAVDAGLGELGRHGLLITPEWGSLQRLGKVFTDMPMDVDKPISFGVGEFCAECKLCATACEVNAIPVDDEPSYEPSATSNPGVLKWHVDAEKCLNYWCETGHGCSTCVRVCPYNSSTLGQGDQLNPEIFWKGEQ